MDQQNKAMKLWTAIVTVFLALCTALGLITTTAAAAPAAPQPETAPKNSAPVPTQTTSHWSRASTRSLPPTMKQRIRAEAHGKTPTCRHHPLADSPSLATDPLCAPADPPARPTIPLQR